MKPYIGLSGEQLKFKNGEPIPLELDEEPDDTQDTSAKELIRTMKMLGREPSAELIARATDEEINS